MPMKLFADFEGWGHLLSPGGAQMDHLGCVLGYGVLQAEAGFLHMG